MKKLFALVLALCLLCAVTACGEKAASVTHNFDGLTITLPEDFINLSDEDFAQGLLFCFGRDPIAINGLKEEKATFQAYGLDLTLEQYATFMMKSNNVSGTLEEKDGIYTFTYEAANDGISYTYVVTARESEAAFWTVQSYCPTDDYHKVKNEMWKYLTSVTV